MNGKTGDEFSKDLIPTEKRGDSKLITLNLTELEIFALVSAVQLADSVIPEVSMLGDCAKQTAKKMHDCLDPNSQLSLQLNQSWE